MSKVMSQRIKLYILSYFQFKVGYNIIKIYLTKIEIIEIS